MKVYEYYLLGSSVRTISRKYKCYIDKINSLYEELLYSVDMYRGEQIDKFEFLTNYVIMYMNVVMCLDALVSENVIEITDKINYISQFEKFYNIHI